MRPEPEACPDAHRVAVCRGDLTAACQVCCLAPVLLPAQVWARPSGPAYQAAQQAEPLQAAVPMAWGSNVPRAVQEAAGAAHAVAEPRPAAAMAAWERAAVAGEA